MTHRLAFSTPEDIFDIASHVEAGVPIDAITCAISRANAVLLMLEEQFETEAPNLSSDVLASVVWDVRGTLGLIRKLAIHADQTSTPIKRTGASQ